jgi:N-glycosylase/DNA lyase
MDPAFAAILQKAADHGVKVLAYSIYFDRDSFYFGGHIPVFVGGLEKALMALKQGPVGQIVTEKIKGFEAMKHKNNDQWFSELCFCILTAGASAEKGIKTQQAVGNGFIHFHKKNLEQTLKTLGCRFHNRAAYMVYNRKFAAIKDIVSSFKNPMDARKWMVDNLQGIGYKEASHFLRNVGYLNLAILDRHILRVMYANGLTDHIPPSISRQRYIELEQVLKQLAARVDMNMAELDLFLWFLETGEVIK